MPILCGFIYKVKILPWQMNNTFIIAWFSLIFLCFQHLSAFSWHCVCLWHFFGITAFYKLNFLLRNKFDFQNHPQIRSSSVYASPWIIWNWMMMCWTFLCSWQIRPIGWLGWHWSRNKRCTKECIHPQHEEGS